MGYALGGPLTQQYEDANGDPLENGTIEFYIWNTSTPTPIYSDDSGTSAGTSVTLNTLGLPTNGGGTPIALFFDTQKVYKIVRKDAAGTAIDPTIGPYFGASGGGVGVQLTVEVIDSAGDDSLYDYVGLDGQQVFVSGYYARGDGGGGNFYWDDISTDSDDGSMTILPTGHVGAGRWIRNYTGALDVRWYGAKGDGVTDDSTALQNCINAAATLSTNVFISAGEYIHATTLYFYYDVTNNPGYPQGLANRGGLMITGIGASNRPSYFSDAKTGAWLTYTGTGVAHSLGSGSGSGDDKVARLIFRDMSIETTATCTRCFDFQKTAEWSGLWNMQIFHLGSGEAIYCNSTWTTVFWHLDIHGNDSAIVANTIGIHMDNPTTAVGGGLNYFFNVTCKYFDTAGFMIGGAGGDTVVMDRVNKLVNCQAGYIETGTGIWFRKGSDGSSLDGFWIEQISGASAIKCSDNAKNITIANGTFIQSVAVGDYGTACIELGSDSVTTVEKYFRSVTLENLTNIPCKPIGIKKHAFLTATNQDAVVRNCAFAGNGDGLGINVDSSDYGGLILHNNRFSNFDNEIQKLCSGDNTALPGSCTDRRWLARDLDESSLEMRAADSGQTADWTALYYTPRFHRNRTNSGDITIQLPINTADYLGYGQPCTFIKQMVANQVILDAGAGNVIKGYQTLALDHAHQAVTIVPFALDISEPSAWATSTAYVIGDLVMNDGGNYYVCQVAGTSAGSGGPTGTDISGITDNTCEWGYHPQQMNWIVSHDASGSYDRSGNDTLSSGTVTITFVEPMPGSAYAISLSGNADETFRWNNKTTTSFDIVSSNASSTATVSWHCRWVPKAEA